MDPSTLVLCCLLYLGTISSPNTYTSCEIATYEAEHHAQIISIESDPPTLNYVMVAYADSAHAIDVEDRQCD